jgi:DDE family transposase
MFALRLGSFNALELELRRPRRWQPWTGAARAPSADTVGRVLAALDPAAARGVLARLNRRAWRAKAIQGRPGEGYRVVAVDGHELWASRARCCAECLTREVTVSGERVREYYHRVVVAQWVGVTPPALLDVERVHAKEGEVVAARRLVARVVATYGRLLDVIVADALYLETAFITTVLAAGKHVVIVMKQEARTLYQDADQLRGLHAPRTLVAGPRTTQLWDLPGLTSFATVRQPLRVIWAEEQTRRRRIIGGRGCETVEAKRWIWVTDLTSVAVGAERIQRWGHSRWDLETRGFNELVTLWHMDHCFIHHPRAIEVLLLTLAVAFLLTYLFYERNLKPTARHHLTRLALAARLREDLAVASSSLWPTVWRSD